MFFFFINTTYFPNNYRIAFANKNNIFHERFGRISSQTINDAYDHDNKGLRFYFEMNIFEEKFVCEGENQISLIVIVFTELCFYYIYSNLVCFLNKLFISKVCKFDITFISYQSFQLNILHDHLSTNNISKLANHNFQLLQFIRFICKIPFISFSNIHIY